MPHFECIQDFLLANGFTYDTDDRKFCRNFIVIAAEDLAGKPLSYFVERYSDTPPTAKIAPQNEKKEKTKQEKAWELSITAVLLSGVGEYGQTETAATYLVLVAAFSPGASMALKLRGKQATVLVRDVREKICEVVANIGSGKADVLDTHVEEALYQEFLANI